MRVSNLSSIWMVHYTEPSRYNWMLQYYLRAEGLALSWVGTGRLIFSLNYTDDDFSAVADRFVAATEKMKRDGWWWHDACLTNKNIKRQILKEMFAKQVRALSARFRQSSQPASLSLPSIAKERSDEAIHLSPCREVDCFASLAMTARRAKDVDARDKPGHDEHLHDIQNNSQACLTCFSRPGSISSPFIRAIGAL